MINAVFCTALCWVYLAICVRLARVEYRRSYTALKDQQVPAVYGHGWMTPADKRTRALHDAYTMFGFWPVVLGKAVIEHVITSCGQADPYVIDTIERELDGTVGEVTVTHRPDDDYMRMKYGDLNEIRADRGIKPAASSTCPCGYVTECPIHCGDGSCHTEDPWLWGEGPEIILTPHPERVRKVAVDPLPHFVILSEVGKCLCPKCRPEMYLWR